MRAGLLAMALLLSPAAAFAGDSCNAACRENSRECRARCVAGSKTSEEQMACRSDCLREDDACRCDCGERTYCEDGTKGQRGCSLPVASLLAFLREALARK